ncbi:MAG: exodeoxyribonuclease VII large subunit [Spirochaetia bacterium]|nr:exodeoxyribonuclease VII large subunit [Spirochaetia bacterium]
MNRDHNFFLSETDSQILTVSQITSLVKEVLESTLMHITIEGEISNFRPASSGHWYFTLKDERSAISAVMFRNRQMQVSVKPRDGQKVIVKGSISVYEQRGTYQIICTSIQAAGEGTILAMLEERKRKFSAEGLFDADRKKSLPLFPKKIVVISSPTGAALKDILQVLARRNSGAVVRVIPAAVQGADAAQALRRGLELANRFSVGDVIIIGRGGGSLEDLLPFSDEQVVRAVAESRIPVISAVGHEIDWALCDYAADRRAPTPSAAAELVTAQTMDLLQKIRSQRDYITSITLGRVSQIRSLLQPFSSNQLQDRFFRYIEPVKMKLDDFRSSMERSLREKVINISHSLDMQKNLLQAHSPRNILERGYAAVTDASTGKLIRSGRQTRIGQHLYIDFSDGRAGAQVEDIRNGNERF